MFASDPVSLDRGAVRMMGHDPDQFSIVREAARVTDLPLMEDSGPALGVTLGSGITWAAVMAVVNGNKMPQEQLTSFAPRSYRLPPGWR